MKIFNKPNLLLFLIIIISFALRFYKLGDIPAGFHSDAASQTYNAFSILKTGKDRYGEAFPILFRAFGSYQPPIYTYLTVLSIIVFGNTIFSARFLSAFSGVILVPLTYLIIKALVTSKDKHNLALASSFIVGISPWALVLSRMTVEANLALTVFAISVYLFVVSLKKIYFFPIASFVLGLSTHAYYSERIISPVFLIIFLYLFRRYFLRSKKWVAIGLFIFALTQIPHLLIINTGALSRRFNQVGYLSGGYQSGVYFRNIVAYLKAFIGHYLEYFSPKYLFSGSTRNLGRMMPDLSAFYSWFIIPFFLGLRFLFKSKYKNLSYLVITLLLISPIPAALTGDVFYPLRTLEFLWIISLIISMGVFTLFHLLLSRLAKALVIIVMICLFSYSFLTLYTSYFILYKYETSESFGYSYVQLINSLDNFKDKKIVIDTGRDLGSGVRIAYSNKIDPAILQNQLRNQLKSPYYSSEVSIDEIYTIGNIEVRPINWRVDSCQKDLIMVGDRLAISGEQVREHELNLLFSVDNIRKEPNLFGYIVTTPGKNCAETK